MDWNDDWREELKTDYYPVWERLAECRNTKKDIIEMSKLNLKYNPSRSKEDCLDRILESGLRTGITNLTYTLMTKNI